MENIRAAVKDLRRSFKGPDGEPISQTEFGQMIGKSLNTIQRYEGLVAPKGAVLIQLHQWAIKQDRQDLAKVFWDAAAKELGQVGIERVDDIWSKALNTRNMFVHSKEPKVEDLLQALTDIANICVEINPVLQWQAGGHRQETEAEDKRKQRKK